MAAADVKSALDFIGFDLSSFSNPSAAIHGTLRRMAATGEINYDTRSKEFSLPYSLGNPRNALYTSGMRPFPGRKK
jgi:hypothetical protein